MTSWPSIPSWQQADLQALAAQGKLSGLNPLILGVIDKEESGGSGGGINSSGYGGFFGLGSGSKYPGGTSTEQLLADPSPSSFDQQAVISASAFAAYLSQQGGDPIKAEEVYQSGSASGPTPGSNLFGQYGISSANAGGGATTGAPAAAQTTGSVFGIPIPGAPNVGLGSIFSGLGLSGLFVRGGLLVFGGILVIVALVVAARGGLNAASGAAGASKQARGQVSGVRSEASQYRRKGGKGGVEEDAEEAAPELAA